MKELNSRNIATSVEKIRQNGGLGFSSHVFVGQYLVTGNLYNPKKHKDLVSIILAFLS